MDIHPYYISLVMALLTLYFFVLAYRREKKKKKLSLKERLFYGLLTQ